MQKSVRMRIARGSVLVGALLVTAQPAGADGAWVETKVKRTIVTSSTHWGGCMARLEESPSSQLSSCRRGWVTFSCSGDFTDKARAYRMFDQAQLALVANKRVVVHFQDNKKHNGYCFAYRIEVLR
jgi:hypothetical protein